MSKIYVLLFWLQIIQPPIVPPRLEHPDLVDRFYQQRNQALYWFLPGEGPAALRQELLSCLDSADWQGLDSNRYNPQWLREGIRLHNDLDSQQLWQWDRIFTDAAILYGKDLYQGAGIDRMISYDGISPTYAKRDDQSILKQMMVINTAANFREWTDGLEPNSPEYALLKTVLGESLRKKDSSRSSQLSRTLNAYRWINHYRFGKFIVVNIPSASLGYYSTDSLVLSMKIVAGQASKRTPRFAAWCDQVILYPYWNVPRKIVIKELLPVFIKSPASIDLMNMQLLDRQGKIVDPISLPWSSFNEKNFPYSVRQSSGCDNALGVIKFNLTSPYDVYMHDTNVKVAFSSLHRYFSHGCIRLEKPFQLGDEILQHTLDTSFLRSCLKDQKPHPINLERPVPVFVVYLTAAIDQDHKIQYYKDVYHLLK